MKARYFNPYTDFGFKKLFGEEANKNLLVDFLNELLPKEHKIVELAFKNPEQLGDIGKERKAIFDIHCKNSAGERFIVEMQKEKLKFFKDRSVFYATFPIKEQAEKGEWNFKLNPVYCVAILDFLFDDDRKQKECISTVQFKDQFGQVFYKKLTFIFIEMPRFVKQENQLTTHFDKWLYFFKYLEDFTGIPEILNEPVFVQGFKTAEIANFDALQMDAYEESLKVYRDLKGVIDTSYEEGETAGLVKGKIEGKIEGKKEQAQKTIKTMSEKGYSMAEIFELAGISPEDLA